MFEAMEQYSYDESLQYSHSLCQLCGSADFTWTYPSCLNLIVHNLTYFPSGTFVEQTPRVTRSQSYACPYAHTNQYYNSFVPHIATICNWDSIASFVYLYLYHP